MTDKNKVLLEEIMAMALDSATEMNAKTTSDFESGRLMAFYEVLSLGKEEADLMGVTFDDERLNLLVPEELLKVNKHDSKLPYAAK